MLKDYVKLESGDVVIQNGANSAVGQCVIQLAKEWNIQTINIIRNRPDIIASLKLVKGIKSLGGGKSLPFLNSSHKFLYMSCFSLLALFSKFHCVLDFFRMNVHCD
jgi:hypothetical protein